MAFTSLNVRRVVGQEGAYVARMLAIVLLVSTSPARGEAQSSTQAGCTTRDGDRVALVLPGGGVKGMAHIGVLEVLDSLGIVPDIVVGTSMGSVVGAMYASGYSGAEIEKLTQRFNIGPYIGHYEPRAPRIASVTGVAGASLLGSELPGEPLPLVRLKYEANAFAVLTSFSDGEAVNLLLSALMMRGDLLARGQFDSLPIPFRVVATDAHTGQRVVLDHGDLAEAIRASVAIPVVFEPITIDGRELVDGGLSENVPVRLARELGATRVILSGLDGGDTSTASSGLREVLDMMMNRIIIESYPPLGPGDIGIHIDVSDISNLDFSARTVADLIARGAAAARTAAAGTATFACMPRRARTVPMARPVTAAIVTATASPGAVALLRSAVAPTDSHLLRWLRSPFARRSSAPAPATTRAADSAAAFRDTIQLRLARLGTSGLVRALWLSPQRVAGDSIAFDPKIRWPPPITMGAGMAFDNELGGQAWVGGAARQITLRDGLPTVAVGGRITISTLRQEAVVTARRSLTDVLRTSPFAMVEVSRESAPSFIRTPQGEALRIELPVMTEELLQLGIDAPAGPSWTMQGGGILRRWHGGLFDSTATPVAVGVATRVDHIGDGNASLGRMDLEWNDHYRRASGELTWTSTNRLATTWHRVRIGATSAGAPYSEWFLLGGTDGFPGLNIGEAVGRWTASYMLNAAHPLFGPINSEVTGATGTVSSDRRLGGEWLFGARLGFGVDALLGRLRLQYGLSTSGRRQWYARVGRWI